MKALKASFFGLSAMLALTMMSCDPQQTQQLTASGLNPAKFDFFFYWDSL